jgi:hypothetical protein
LVDGKTSNLDRLEVRKLNRPIVDHSDRITQRRIELAIGVWIMHRWWFWGPIWRDKRQDSLDVHTEDIAVIEQVISGWFLCKTRWI